SYGAVLDNPDLIVACVVGDGEAETGPLATAWHSNKFLNPITSGAVLPILHLNGYKISGPTIMGTMDNSDLMSLFKGYGYEPIIVEGDFLFEPMLAALEGAYSKIKSIQQEARESGNPGQPRWPMIILRSPKGWFGPESSNPEMPIVGSHRSHGIPIQNPQKVEEEFIRVKEWLESYKIHELIDSSYSLHDGLLDYVPEGDLRMGMNRHTRAADTRDLVLPEIKDYKIDVKKHGELENSSTDKLAEYMRDIFEKNDTYSNFRIFSPDETESNKLGKLFEATKRAYLWPVKSYDEDLSPNGRVMEMLSEHTLQGWLQGYTLTGRHGILITYEAFAEIISSMVDQYVKFVRHAQTISWRNAIPSLNYVLTSLNWRQDHNGFSHQNPGFISSVLNNHADFVEVYFPADSNTMLAVAEEVFASKNGVNVIVAGKRPLNQWLTLEQAKKQVTEDIQIWDFLSDDNPDVVIVGCGDYAMREVVAARKLLREKLPELRVRVINITQLSCFGIGDNEAKCRINAMKFDELFTTDKSIIFNYHGYAEDIKSLIFGHHSASRFSIHGYNEVGTTTTPFDMLVKNKIDRYNLALEAIKHAVAKNATLGEKTHTAEEYFHSILEKHESFILEHGYDIPEVEEFDYSV
ncbi:phosphoketolase family protein, partial [Candidatus Dojkabacteria bacterium]|nr:phosphoketolase family protein [Candidatus Dojkabacteria bacterium]